jgi:hypothetical protein
MAAQTGEPAMLRWKLLIIATSAVAALALGMSAQAATEDVDLQAMLTNAFSALS